MKYIVLVPLLLVPVYTFAMPLSEMVQQAVKTHPQIQVVREDLYVQKEGLTQIKSDNLPTLDTSYTVGPESTRTPANDREKADLTRQEADITLVQNVFAGFDTSEGIKQQKALILSADKQVEEAANNLAIEAVSAYIEVLKTHAFYKIATKNVEVHEKYLNQIDRKVKAGVQRHSDYQQTLSRLESAKSLQYLSQQNYENSIYSFKRILPAEITGSDLVTPMIGDLPAQDLETLVQMAIENNPIIHVTNADIKASYAAVQRAKAPFYPRADIRAQAYWSDEVHGVGYNTGINRAKSDDSGYNALLVLSYNIFNGLADSSAKQASQHRYLKQQSTLIDAKRFIAANTQIAWRTFDLTKMQLVHIDKNVEASKLTVSDYEKEHKLGRRSIIDLLNIELEYTSAKNRQVTAQHEQLLAYYQILSNTGKLLEEMDITLR